MEETGDHVEMLEVFMNSGINLGLQTHDPWSYASPLTGRGREMSRLLLDSDKNRKDQLMRIESAHHINIWLVEKNATRRVQFVSVSTKFPRWRNLATKHISALKLACWSSHG